jgi:hypothetical protein
MSSDSSEPGHGDSIAAWATVSIIIVAFTLGTLFFWLDQAVLVWASFGLALLGLGVGAFLKKLAMVSADRSRETNCWKSFLPAH